MNFGEIKIMVDNGEVLKKWLKQNNKKEYQKHIANAEPLKKNSEELVKILKDENILFDGMKIFEIGCGCGRNLDYLNKTEYDIDFFGNDLVQKECFRYMDEDLKKKITFFEKETLSLFDDIFDVDLFISSDHLMHLVPQSVVSILEKIRDQWKPRYVLLRETTKAVSKGKRKWVHDYSIIEKEYDYIYREKSEGNKDYVIRLLKRKSE